MADLRRAYAATQYANLDWSEIAERPVDRVAAAGHTRNLEVWKAAYSADRPAYVKLQRMLRRVFVSKYPRDPLVGCIVDQALHEFLSPSCRACHGHQVAPGIEAMVCQSCGGSGAHRYSDAQRSTLMQISFAQARRAAAKITWLVGWLTGQDKEINRLMNEALGRGELVH